MLDSSHLLARSRVRRAMACWLQTQASPRDRALASHGVSASALLLGTGSASGVRVQEATTPQPVGATEGQPQGPLGAGPRGEGHRAARHLGGRYKTARLFQRRDVRHQRNSTFATKRTVTAVAHVRVETGLGSPGASDSLRHIPHTGGAA